MDWGGKADSPNSHITLKYKIQAFFPAFQKQSPGHSSPIPALEGEEGTRSCGLFVTGTELDWGAKGRLCQPACSHWHGCKINLSGGGRRVFIHGKGGRGFSFRET